jgi:hypothetical protein
MLRRRRWLRLGSSHPVLVVELLMRGHIVEQNILRGSIRRNPIILLRLVLNLRD